MTNINIENLYKERKILIKDLIALTDQEINTTIKELLEEMYESKVEITDQVISKVLKLVNKKAGSLVNLEKNLIVLRDDNYLTFKFREKRGGILLFIILLCSLLFALAFATFSAVTYYKYAELNKDLNGDLVADLNIDLDGDNVADLNIDLDGDNIPDLNIDYKCNKTPVFNLDKDNDGVADFNLVNDATSNPASCKLNCDLDGDGWPDFNIDINGDGIADFDIYDSTTGKPGISIDVDGDGVCDVNCDDDNDGVCDRNCTDIDYVIKPSGPECTTVMPDYSYETGSLLIMYEDLGELSVDDMYPDDQPEMEVFYPTKSFLIKNLSDVPVTYKLVFNVKKNTFTSDNFKYKLESTNGGYSADFVTAPTEDEIIHSYVTLPGNTTQEYTITFKLEGIGESQNYDQGKVFQGNIEIVE